MKDTVSSGLFGAICFFHDLFELSFLDLILIKQTSLFHLYVYER